jgi:hypothetical protein
MGLRVPELVEVLACRHHDVVAVVCPRRQIDWERVERAVLAHPDIDTAKLATVSGDRTGTFVLLD